MKKITVLCMCLLLLLAALACTMSQTGNSAGSESNNVPVATETPEPTPTPVPTPKPIQYLSVEKGKEYKIDGICSFTMKKITYRPYVMASYGYYKITSGTNNPAVAFCFSFTNRSGKAIDRAYLSEHFSFSDESLRLGVAADSENGKRLDTEFSIDANKTKIIYIYSFSESSAETITLLFDVDDAHYQADFVKSNYKDDTIALKANQKQIIKNYGEVTYLSAYTTEKLEPQNPGRWSYYYQPNNANEILFVAEFKVKNLDKEPIHPSSIFGSSTSDDCMITIKGYQYPATCYISVDNDSEITGIRELTPLQETKLFMVASVPKSLANNSATLNLIFYGQHFSVATK